MTRKYTAVIVKGESQRWYVAHCVELGVVTQGKTIEEAKTNLQEAVELFLETADKDEIPASTADVTFSSLEVSGTSEATVDA